MTMRSFWMDRLRGHADAGDGVLARPATALSASSLPLISKKTSATPTRVTGAFKRLCLGIGDGGVRRQ
jgi:hypothetical protein